jgi:hypothetical protein
VEKLSPDGVHAWLDWLRFDGANSIKNYHVANSQGEPELLISTIRQGGVAVRYGLRHSPCEYLTVNCKIGGPARSFFTFE